MLSIIKLVEKEWFLRLWFDETCRQRQVMSRLTDKEWVTTYYDPYLGLGQRQEDHWNMTQNCTRLITDIRDGHTKLGIELPY